MASAAAQYYIGGSRFVFNLNGVSTTAQTIDDANDKIATMFDAPDASQAITHIDVRCSAIAGTAPTMRVLLEGFTAAGGIPDGTDAGGVSTTSVDFTPVAGTTHHLQLTNSFTPTEGTPYAAVLEYASGTINVSNSSTFIRSYALRDLVSSPYCLSDITGSWAKVASVHPCISPVYNNGFIVPGTEVFVSGAQSTRGSGSTPDEWGNLWVPDDSCTIVGVAFGIRMLTTTADFSFILRSSDDTALVEVAIDGEDGDSVGQSKLRCLFFDDISITGGLDYRLVFRPDTVNSVRSYEMVFGNSSHRASAGGSLQKTERTDAGSWTDTDTEFVTMWPILSDISAGSTAVNIHNTQTVAPFKVVPY